LANLKDKIIVIFPARRVFLQAGGIVTYNAVVIAIFPSLHISLFNLRVVRSFLPSRQQTLPSHQALQ
jgi:hypothetical protein